MAPRRFVPCGREYRRDTETFAPGKPELCRDPRYCPHCDRIAELAVIVQRLLHPIKEITVPADMSDTEGLGDKKVAGFVGPTRPDLYEVLDIEPNDD